METRLKSILRSKKFKVLSAKPGFRGKLTHLDVLQIRTRSGRRYERELIQHPGAAVVIPRLRDGRLILIYQLRIAAGDEIWEFPAGTLEKGESVRRCAGRELQEETGWRAGRLRQLIEFYPTPGISTEKMFIFLAEDLEKASGQNPDPDEELRIKIFTVREIDQMIRRGRIIDGKTILGFLFYLRYISPRRP